MVEQTKLVYLREELGKLLLNNVKMSLTDNFSLALAISFILAFHWYFIGFEKLIFEPRVMG